MAQRDLRAVLAAAERLASARDELADKILAASRSGESIRDIARFIGWKPTRVHGLLDEARRRERE